MVDKFDLKKYRDENPMDYLEVIKLINENPGNNTIMRTIYEITRLHIPDTVYKYYSLSKDNEENNIKFNTLSNNKIYMAHPNSFNDPFENNAFFYQKEKLMKYSFLQRFDGRFIDDFSNYVRMSSFTNSGINCMPMWAHYANNHQGYCVSYNTKIKENINLRSSIFPVQYVDERIDITSIMETVIDELLVLKEKAKLVGKKVISIDNLIVLWISIYFACLKHSSWSYEKEFRCVTASNSPGMPYLNATPSAIYLGAKCSGVNKKHLVDIAFQLNIPIHDMEMDDYTTKYELTPKKIG